MRLREARLGLRVLQLHRADAPQVVQVAALLRVGARRRRLRLRTQLLRLLVLRVVQVVAQQQVQVRLLPEPVAPRHRRAVQPQQRRARVRRRAVPLVRQRVVKGEARAERVERAAVGGGGDERQRALRGVQHARVAGVRQRQHAEQVRVRLRLGKRTLRGAGGTGAGGAAGAGSPSAGGAGGAGGRRPRAIPASATRPALEAFASSRAASRKSTSFAGVSFLRHAMVWVDREHEFRVFSGWWGSAGDAGRAEGVRAAPNAVARASRVSG